MMRPLLSILFLALSGCTPLSSSPADDAAAPAGDHGPPADRGQLDGAAEAGATRRLVVVILNTHSFQEGTGSLQKLEAIGKGLAALKVDLVGLNEVMSGTFWSYHYNGKQYDGAAMIKKALEAASGVPYYSYSQGFAHWSSGEQMANVVLSRTAITESGSRSLTTTDFWPAPKEKRNVVYARTVIPGFGPLNLLVTHAWGWDSVDTATQISEVKSFLAQKIRGDEILNLVVGDLNLPSTHKTFPAWLAAPVKLVDTYGEANPKGNTDPTTIKGQHRIDHLLCDRRSWSFTSTLVFDGTNQPVVSDHKGVKTVFELVK